MDRPICRLCGSKHYSTEPHVWGKDEPAKKVQRKAEPTLSESDVAQVGLGSNTGVEPKGVPIERESCPECGATAKTFTDAQKWSKHREKRRIYMKQHRGKK